MRERMQSISFFIFFFLATRGRKQLSLATSTCFFYDAVTCSAVCVTMEGCLQTPTWHSHEILACLPREVPVLTCVSCQGSDRFSESCHMLRYDSGSAAPAEPPSCGWIDLVCVAVCRNNFEPLLHVYISVCVSLKGHEIESYKVGKLWGLSFSFNCLCCRRLRGLSLVLFRWRHCFSGPTGIVEPCLLLR